MTTSCPCGSGLPFETCCALYLNGTTLAPSAEALMRSRYSAFVQRDWAYLNRTQVQQDNGPPTPDMEWLGLDVLVCHAGGPDDTEGTVEFVARYSHEGRPGSLHEISHFHKENDQWLYVSGEFPRTLRQVKTGRNDPCPCGSGKKFKKCCGK